jgi:hypothetical protein
MLILNPSSQRRLSYFNSLCSIISKDINKSSFWQSLPSVQSIINSGQLMLPGIRAPAEDLIIVISKNKEVVKSKLVLKGPKHLYHYNLIHSAYHMPRAYKLLPTLFDK